MSSRKERVFSPQYINEIVLDEDFKQLRACIQCGECSAACPSGNWTPIRTRRIMRRAITGVEDVLSDPEIWMCSTCFNCFERCPRDIPVTDVILKLRNIAVREGYLPDALKGVINNLIELRGNPWIMIRY